MATLSTLLTVVALVCAGMLPSTALECWDCTSLQDDCVEKPVNDTSCPSLVKYCVIIRSEINGELSTLSRGCGMANLPDNMINQTYTAGPMKTYYSACSDKYCNYGDGYLPDKVVKCYSCVTKNETSDCVLKPASGASAVECTTEYCGIIRTKSSGSFTFNRTCLSGEYSAVANTTVMFEDKKVLHTMHISGCATELCNKGDGIVIDTSAAMRTGPASLAFTAAALLALLGGRAGN